MTSHYARELSIYLSIYLQIRFWYHIHGEDVGTLTVYQRTSYIPTLGGIYKLSDITGNSDYWHPMEITLPDTGTDFQVRCNF